MLLTFDVVAAGLFALAPKTGAHLARFAASARQRPFRFFILLVVLSALAYLPLALAFNAMRWSFVGPFTVQTSRVLHYLLYFVVGIGVGAHGLDRGLLATSMAMLAVVVRFARPSAILDSLRDNAYGMYLIHYAIVTWVQYALLPAPWPGLAKAAVAFAGTVALSWFATATARRVAVHYSTRRAPMGNVTRA